MARLTGIELSETSVGGLSTSLMEAINVYLT
jgi:hypothetical protein